MYGALLNFIRDIYVSIVSDYGVLTINIIDKFVQHWCYVYNITVKYRITSMNETLVKSFFFLS